MSIIFQTLNKLQATPPAAPSAQVVGDRPAVAEPIPASRRRPLLVTAMVAGAFVILGFALIFGVRFLGNHAGASGAEAVASQEPVAGAHFFAAAEPAQLTVAVRETTPRYLPPDSAPQAHAPSGGGSAAGTGNVPPPPDTNVATPSGEMHVAPERRDNAPPPAAPVSAATGKDDAVIESSKTMAHGGESSPTESEPMTAEQRKAEAARQAAREKNERISRLVSRLEASLSSAAPDQHGVETLLGELARLKQPGSLYVDKLRAYWLLKIEQYDRARALLEKLAAADEEDVEVGINLAVIDIRQGDIQAARLRLQRLKKAHPDNTRITELIRKLQ